MLCLRVWKRANISVTHLALVLGKKKKNWTVHINKQPPENVLQHYSTTQVLRGLAFRRVSTCS